MKKYKKYKENQVLISKNGHHCTNARVLFVEDDKVTIVSDCFNIIELNADDVENYFEKPQYDYCEISVLEFLNEIKSNMDNVKKLLTEKRKNDEQ